MTLEFLSISATILTFATLALSGYRHLGDGGSLSSALNLRFGLGRQTCERLARLIGRHELAVGVGGLVGAVIGPRILLRILTCVALGTYALYSWHVASLLARGASVPCGCTSDTAPANGGALARTLALVCAAAFAALNPPMLATASATAVLVAALAGATFTTLLESLPSAMAGVAAEGGGRAPSPTGLTGEEP